MFEGLKKKFSSFINSVSKKEEAIVEKEEEKHSEEPVNATRNEEINLKREEEKSVINTKKVSSTDENRKDYPKHEEKTVAETQIPIKERSKNTEYKDNREENEPQTNKNHEPANEIVKMQDAGKNKEEKPFSAGKKETSQKTERESPKVGMGTRLKSVFMREVKINSGDIDPFMEELRISLLESDVNYDVSEKVVEKIKSELLSNPIPAKEINKEIKAIIKRSILSILSHVSTKSLVEIASEKKRKGELPLKILFIGPNGAGKTTTIAKIADLLSKNGFSCLISASDTFRAAAVEQTVHHANKLGIEVIKGKYGADPASIAFDAVAHAKAAGINVVLIDSAGRQETNKNLMEEMKKMVRVANPDLKIFIGEGIAGNSLIEQVRQFNGMIKLDGIILTKLDADAKGGNTLSILSETEIPVLYFGTGEKYGDLMPYDPNFIIDNMIPN